MKLEDISVHSKGLKGFFHVKNREDYDIKRSEVEKRYEGMHRYGYEGCNEISREYFQNIFVCSVTCFVMGICPCCCINYWCYHCYSGVSNWCYKMGSRSQKLFETYQKFQKCPCSSEPRAKKNERIELLTEVLAHKNKIRQNALEHNSNTI